jgi:hypothetical protein
MPKTPSLGPALQLKARLLEVSPMVWRRLLVPGTTSLRELHGILQVAMGWEGIHLFQVHLRAVRYASPELSAFSPGATLADFRLRTGSRFIYEYGLNASWQHEIRIERQLEREAGARYPLCLDGHTATARPRATAGRPVISPGSTRPWALRP